MSSGLVGVMVLLIGFPGNEWAELITLLDQLRLPRVVVDEGVRHLSGSSHMGVHDIM